MTSSLRQALILAVIGSFVFTGPAIARQVELHAVEMRPAIELKDGASLLQVLMALDEQIDEKFETSGRAASKIRLKLDRESVDKARWSLGNPTDPTGEGREVGNVNLFLISAHRTYQYLKHHGPKCSDDKPTPECATLKAMLKDLNQVIHRLLEQRNLHWEMAAILRTGMMIGDGGDGAKESFDRSELVSKTSGVSYVDFELPHLGDGVKAVDATVSGHFGYAPIMALVRKRPDSATAEPNKLMAMYMPGFTWSTSFRANYQLSKSELSLFVTTGRGRLSDLDIKLGADEKAAIGDVVRNDVGRWAWQHSVGLEYRYFGADLDFVHHDASRMLTPRLSLAVAFKHDERFLPREELAAFGPPKRLNTRMSVNIVEWVRDTATVGKGNDPATVRVVFENDQPLQKLQPRVPSGNRLYIEANADLLKLFGFGDAKAEEKK